MKPKIFLIDGHTLPKDTGALVTVSPYDKDWNEAKLIRVLSSKIYDKIDSRFDVVYFNVDDKNLNDPLFRKIQVINYSYTDIYKDLAIEIHFDFSSNPKVQGRSVIVGSNIELGKAFYDTFDIYGIENDLPYVITKYWKNEYLQNKQARQLNRELGMISQTKISAIIVENLFLSSPHDMEWLFGHFEENMNKMAECILAGINLYYKNTFGV